MTKSDDIPQDVWEVAHQVSYDMTGSESGDLAIIARALLAERERCAKVAENRFTVENVLKTKNGEPYITGQCAIYAAKQVAAAIRNPNT